MKNNEWHTVTLNEGARFVLDMQRGMDRKCAFPYRGRPVRKPSTRAWREALVRAGIKNFRWHDLRHTWASWLRQKGVPLDALRLLGGWSSLAMVERYAHLDAEHLAPYSALVPNLAHDSMAPTAAAAAPACQSTPIPANVIRVTFPAQQGKKKGHS